MEERLRAAQNDVRWGPDHHPLNVILRGNQQNQCKGPKIPSNGPECNHGSLSVGHSTDELGSRQRDLSTSSVTKRGGRGLTGERETVPVKTVTLGVCGGQLPCVLQH